MEQQQIESDENGILHAYEVLGDGKGIELKGQAVADTVESDKLAWVHLDANNPAARAWLEKEISYLDPLILNALLAEETRPRITEYEQGVMMILRGVNLNENANPEDMISIRLWVDEHRIISIRRRKLKAVQDIRAMLENGHGPKDSGDFICMLSQRLFERMEGTLTSLDEHLDDIEERVMDDPELEERQEIINMRKEAITYRRYIAPQRDVMMHLKTADISWLTTSHRRHLQESYDRITRYTEDLDMMRERAQIIKDELTNALSDRLNKNMYILSVIAAIFLPLGFLTGLFGINVGGIPGADNDMSFAIFCGMLTVIVVLQIILFKKMKWF